MEFRDYRLMSQDSRVILGGNWDNGSQCGSRASNCNNGALNLNDNHGARGVSDTGILLRANPSAGLIDLVGTAGKIHNGGPAGPVVYANVRRGILL